MIQRNISDNYSILLGVLGLLLFYFIHISIFLLQGGETNYLTLGMVTDFSYLQLMTSEDIYLKQGLTFSFLPLVIERQFISLFGFQNTWIMLILYKISYFLILLVGFKNLINPKSRTLNMMVISLVLFVCIDIAPFWDRYPRPLFDNIFLISIFIFNLFVLQKRVLSYLSFSIFGLSHAILALTNPWSAVIIAPMSLVSIVLIIRSKSYLKPALSLLSFLLVILPTIIYFYGNLDGSSHREFLGLKDIYNSNLFIQDYFISLLRSKQFLLILIIIIFSSFFLKRWNELCILILCTFFAPLAFIILGKSIQSYHLTNGSKEFEILICITLYIYLIQKNNLMLFNLKIKNLNLKIVMLSSVLSFSLIFILGNSWILRSNEVQSSWQKYITAFNFLDEKPSSCVIVSNDQNIRRYWSGLKNGNTLPEDGFIRTTNIESALIEVATAINVLNKNRKLNKEEVSSLLKYATHNYFVSTRSTLAKTFPFKDNNEKKDYLHSRRAVNSFYHWTYAPPDRIYDKLFQISDDLKRLDVPKDTIEIITTADKGEIKFDIVDSCSLSS